MLVTEQTNSNTFPDWIPFVSCVFLIAKKLLSCLADLGAHTIWWLVHNSI